MNSAQDNGRTAGICSIAASYFLWGILAIYWRCIDEVPAFEILAHRIFWSFLFVVLIIVLTKKTGSFWAEVRQLVCDKSRIFSLVMCALLITINWLIYIWAVNAERILETSFGYYMNPVLSVFLGIVVLKERLSFWQLIAFLLVAVGVANMAFSLRSVPWVSISLAVSFAFYGLYKKKVNLSAFTGIALETLLVMPVALGYIIYLHHLGVGAFGQGKTLVTAMLFGAGVVTAVPLLLFSYGANRLPLMLVGFIQYLSPTLTLLIGVFVYHEHFTTVHMISFGFIWLALIVFSLAETRPLMKLEAMVVKIVTDSQ